jgi:hypothetical protein
MNDLYPVYNPYPFDVPDAASDLALDNVQMAFTKILRLREEGKEYDTYKLIKLGAEFGRALMLFIDGMDEEEAAKHGPTTDPYDAMRDAADLQEIFDRR